MKIKNTLIACITGIGVGMPISILCIATLGGFDETVKEVLVWLVASALFGVLSLIFNSGKLNLILSTAIHCVGCLAVTCTACTINGYSDNFFDILVSVLPVFAIVYIVIYSAAMVSAKAEAKKINESLNK